MLRGFATSGDKSCTTGHPDEPDGTLGPSRPWKEKVVAESVYKIVELVGTSTESWEKAATAAVEKASKSIRNLRIAEVSELDLHIEDGKVSSFRAKVKLSFKYED